MHTLPDVFVMRSSEVRESRGCTIICALAQCEHVPLAQGVRYQGYQNRHEVRRRAPEYPRFPPPDNPTIGELSKAWGSLGMERSNAMFRRMDACLCTDWVADNDQPSFLLLPHNRLDCQHL
jgi:hypothetical protein